MNKQRIMDPLTAAMFLDSHHRHEENRFGVKEVAWYNNGGSMVASGRFVGTFSREKDSVSINKTETFDVTYFSGKEARELYTVGIPPKQSTNA